MVRRSYSKVSIEGRFVRKRVEDAKKLQRAGFTRFVTVQKGEHKLVLACKVKGRGCRAVTVLSPATPDRVKRHGCNLYTKKCSKKRGR